MAIVHHVHLMIMMKNRNASCGSCSNAEIWQKSMSDRRHAATAFRPREPLP